MTTTTPTTTAATAAGTNWRRFIAPYYALNALALLAYLPIRHYFWSPVLVEREGFLNIPREHEIFLLIGAMFLLNYRKKATIDGIIAMFFMYGKTGVLATLWYLDRRIFGWMLVYCAILFVAVGYPKYRGPTNIQQLNPALIEQHIKRQGGYQENKKNVSWLVVFYADWSDHCLHHEAMFAELSMQFGSDVLRFGRVDVNQYPDLAREYQIEVSTTSWQLPTLVLFQGGQEVRRLPRIEANGDVAKVILDRPGVIKVFMLEELKTGKKSAFLSKKTK